MAPLATTWLFCTLGQFVSCRCLSDSTVICVVVALDVVGFGEGLQAFSAMRRLHRSIWRRPRSCSPAQKAGSTHRSQESFRTKGACFAS